MSFFCLLLVVSFFVFPDLQPPSFIHSFLRVFFPPWRPWGILHMWEGEGVEHNVGENIEHQGRGSIGREDGKSPIMHKDQKDVVSMVPYLTWSPG